MARRNNLHSEGVIKGLYKYGNSSKEELDAEHNIEARIENPGDVDEEKWAAAKKAAEKEYGAGHWEAVSYIYKKMGGEFHRKK